MVISICWAIFYAKNTNCSLWTFRDTLVYLCTAVYCCTGTITHGLVKDHNLFRSRALQITTNPCIAKHLWSCTAVAKCNTTFLSGHVYCYCLTILRLLLLYLLWFGKEDNKLLLGIDRYISACLLLGFMFPTFGWLLVHKAKHLALLSKALLLQYAAIYITNLWSRGWLYTKGFNPAHDKSYSSIGQRPLKEYITRL